MSKGMKTFLPSWAILMLLFNVIAWVVPADHDKTFYTAYGFAMGAMIVQLLIGCIGLNSNEKKVKYPLMIFSLCGVLLVVLIGVICVWLKAKAWIVVVIESIVLALNWLTVIATKTRHQKG